jgi:transposase-like protein
MTKKPADNAGNVCKSYTEESGRDAVRMIEVEGLTTAEVGRRLGVHENLLRKWREKYGTKSEAQSVLSDLEAQVRRLRDENRRLWEQRSQDPQFQRSACAHGGVTLISLLNFLRKIQLN